MTSLFLVPKLNTVHIAKERGLWVLTECYVFGILKLHAGALGAEVPRQPIPNLAVKLYSGNNTVGAALWKDSSVPAANFIQSHA